MTENEEAKQQREEAQQQLTVQNSSYILVDYTIKVKDTGEVVDTTIEEEAKKAGIFDASRVYEPRLVVPGKGMLLQAIEEQLIGMTESSSKTFEIPPERAFGHRDASKIKTIPLRKFKDLDTPLTVGARVVVDGKEGIVRTIGSGRVQVDFNPYLAGKTLECNITVKRIITDELEKIKAIVHNRIPDVDIQKFEIKMEKPVVNVKIPEDAFLLPALQINKRVIAREIKEAVEGIEKIIFCEEYA
ncbi:MAG TPA: peptidylprolyl isomerase [Aigarchaeota archaeon]|nr:peptidylprolyl isomerase [Aigarchaeota archaeon]